MPALIPVACRGAVLRMTEIPVCLLIHKQCITVFNCCQLFYGVYRQFFSKSQQSLAFKHFIPRFVPCFDENVEANMEYTVKKPVIPRFIPRLS
jgi:hypothetical protein